MDEDIARIDLQQAIRTISFENPSGAKGEAGQAHAGRKGAPNRFLSPGEWLVLAVEERLAPLSPTGQ